MFSLFLEQPLTIAAIGGMTVVMLIGGLLKTANAKLIPAILGVILLTLGLVAVERMIITPVERVQETVHAIARELKSNNIAGVQRHLASTVPQLRDEAAMAMKRLEIHQVKVKRNLKAEVTEKSAIATFNAVIVVSERKGHFQNQTAPRFVTLHLVLEGSQWKVSAYQMKEPL